MVKIGALPSLGVLGALLGTAYAQGIQLTITDDNSIKNAAKEASKNMLSFYHGDEPGRIPGLMDKPYYWWEGGAMFGLLINYWQLTGDTQYNDMVYDGVLFQIGENQDFEPSNRTNELGNDDQQFWAFTAMDAAEAGFKDPPADMPGWLALAQAVFHRQIDRWEPSTCNGGLPWQTTPLNKGYTYKNLPSNGGLFHLCARLARYTNNETYAIWAERLWDWVVGVGYVQTREDGSISIYDGGHWDNNLNCTDVNKVQWTYNYGTIMNGLSYMYNYTNGATKWKTNLDAVIAGMQIMFVAPTPDENTPGAAGSGNIIAEIACELQNPQTCNQDNPAFKSFTMHWVAIATQLAPYTAGTLLPLIRASAERVPNLCKGGPTGTFCARRWYQATMDGNFGLGEQMSAMSIFQNLLIERIAPPFTADRGGTSKGNNNAGQNGRDILVHKEITTADKGGAGFLTFLVLGCQVAGAYWMMIAKE